MPHSPFGIAGSTVRKVPAEATVSGLCDNPRFPGRSIMNISRVLMGIISMLVISAGLLNSQTTTHPDRQICITIDDLPAGAADSMSAATITDLTSKIVTTLRDQKVPAVGFVNEKKLYKWGEVDERSNELQSRV